MILSEDADTDVESLKDALEICRGMKNMDWISRHF